MRVCASVRLRPCRRLLSLTIHRSTQVLFVVTSTEQLSKALGANRMPPARQLCFEAMRGSFPCGETPENLRF